MSSRLMIWRERTHFGNKFLVHSERCAGQTDAVDSLICRAQISFDDLEFREETLCRRNGYGRDETMRSAIDTLQSTVPS